MINFTLCGLKFSFEFGFFAMAAVFCLVDAADTAVTGVCACIIHELGHCFAATAWDIKIERINFWAGGVRMISSVSLKSHFSDAVILLSGPFINFVAAMIFFSLGMEQSFQINFALGLFNLLPFSNLDGGQLIRNFVESRGINPEWIMKALSLLTALVLLCLFLADESKNITGCITVVLLTVYEFCY